MCLTACCLLIVDANRSCCRCLLHCLVGDTIPLIAQKRYHPQLEKHTVRKFGGATFWRWNVEYAPPNPRGFVYTHSFLRKSQHFISTHVLAATLATGRKMSQRGKTIYLNWVLQFPRKCPVDTKGVGTTTTEVEVKPNAFIQQYKTDSHTICYELAPNAYLSRQTCVYK